MSVIIRLQNLPWAANARDIRDFFAGLSIPEGGVHIIGGEMGDAFIAFSTDEDARKAMLKDREKLMEVQVRLLLSSRSEMQKIIETARQPGIAAAAATPAVAVTAQPKVVSNPLGITLDPPTISHQMPSITNSPLINANAGGLQNFLKQATLSKAPTFLAYQQQAGLMLNDLAANTLIKPNSLERPSQSISPDSRRSSSRERRRSRSRSHSRERSSGDSLRRQRRDRSRSWSRERDWLGHNSRSDHRQNSREHNTGHNSHDRNNVNRNSEADNKHKSPNISPWNMPPTNSYQPLMTAGAASLTNVTQQPTTAMQQQFNSTAATTNPGFTQQTAVGTPLFSGMQSYSTTNNYSVNLLTNNGSTSTASNTDAALPQNSYLAALQSSKSNNTADGGIPGLSLTMSQQQIGQATPTPTFSAFLQDTKQSTTNIAQPPQLLPQTKFNSLLSTQSNLMPTQTQITLAQQPAQQTVTSEPVAYANVNPYAQIYPQLFEQAAARSNRSYSPLQTNTAAQTATTNSGNGGGGSGNSNDNSSNASDTCYVKVSNLCSSTTYSDLRKFFNGLFIPHNGIKMPANNQGIRNGVAYIEFSRVSSAQKALTRSNTHLNNKLVQVEPIKDAEFELAEDSACLNRQNEATYGAENNEYTYNSSNVDIKQQTLNVLFLEDLPQYTTEQDIMKIFSSYTIIDILMCASPHNRREHVAHVQFSREQDAQAALKDVAKHIIGYRKIRVRPGSVQDKETAKEKLRLASEQLLKEEAGITMLANTEIKNGRRMESDNDNVSGNDKRSRSKYDKSYNRDGGDKFNSDPRKRSKQQQQQQSHPQTQQQQQLLQQQQQLPSLMSTSHQYQNINNNHNRNQDNNSSTFVNMLNFNNINHNNHGPFQNNAPNPAQDEEKYVLVKNCEYGTRINDIGEWLSAGNLRMNHIEILYNERNLPAGEFIIEFYDRYHARRAVREYHNRRFRGRSIRFVTITPQEIADRLGKPFLNYMPGGGNNCSDGQSLVKAALELISRGVVLPDNTDPINNNILQQNNYDCNPNNYGSNKNHMDNSIIGGGGSAGGGVSGSGKQHRNPFADRSISDIDHNNDIANGTPSAALSAIVTPPAIQNSKDEGIPDKFNRPGCVIAMRNVPFKAHLKDILRFFNDYKLNPEDIIRRFNDDGSPTGDARVAFENAAQARNAFESRKKRQIFNRNIYLSLL